MLARNNNAPTRNSNWPTTLSPRCIGMMASRLPIFTNKLAPGANIHDQLKPPDLFDDPANSYDTTAAAKSFVALAQTVVAANPDNPDYLHFLALSTREMADTLDLDPAQSRRDRPFGFLSPKRSNAGNGVAKKPDNVDWQHDLSVSYDRLGDWLMPTFRLTTRRKPMPRVSRSARAFHPGFRRNPQYLNDARDRLRKVCEYSGGRRSARASDGNVPSGGRGMAKIGHHQPKERQLRARLDDDAREDRRP